MTGVPEQDQDAVYARARAQMLEEIRSDIRRTRDYLGKDELAPDVMSAMAKVPRHRFVPVTYRDRAYENHAQPIGHGQTISQPYMVAVITDLAQAGAGSRVLEVGSGCGYQCAVLAEAGAEVFGIEVVPELARASQTRLAGLGYDKVRVRNGDGAKGWPEEAPFDAVIVSAAAWREVPPALLEQLKPGGRLVVPLERGPRNARFPFFSQDQVLLLIEKQDNGSLRRREILPVAFVPLVSTDAQEEPS